MANPLYGSNRHDQAIQSGGLGPVYDLIKDVTLTTAVFPSGSILRFTPPSGAGALDIILPAHKDGIVYHIYQSADYDTAVCNVSSADGNDWQGNIDAATGAGDTAAASDDKVIFGSGSLAGDKISIISWAKKWFVFESYSVVTSNGVLFG